MTLRGGAAMNRVVAVAAAVGLVVALPASASAKRYQAYTGNPSQPPKSAPDGTELNQFFPKKLKVRQGDTVKYASLGAHTVSVLPRGATFPPPIVGDPAGGTYTGINDPQGAPFFYNGLAKFIYNTQVFTKSGDGNVRKKDPGENSGL